MEWETFVGSNWISGRWKSFVVEPRPLSNRLKWLEIKVFFTVSLVNSACFFLSRIDKSTCSFGMKSICWQFRDSFGFWCTITFNSCPTGPTRELSQRLKLIQQKPRVNCFIYAKCAQPIAGCNGYCATGWTCVYVNKMRLRNNLNNLTMIALSQYKFFWFDYIINTELHA